MERLGCGTVQQKRAIRRKRQYATPSTRDPDKRQDATPSPLTRQFTKPGHPWQNGRIERLFGTLKERWRELAPELRVDVPLRLTEFAHWYNATRPHQHLQGCTPLQAWSDDNGPLIRWRMRQWWGGALRAVQRE